MKKVITFLVITMAIQPVFAKEKGFWGVGLKSGGGYECIYSGAVSLEDYLNVLKKDKYEITKRKESSGAVSYIAKKQGAESTVFTTTQKECLNLITKPSTASTGGPSDSKNEFKLWKEIVMLCPDNVGKKNKIILELSRVSSSTTIYMNGFKNDSSPGSVFSLEQIVGSNPHFDPKIKKALSQLKNGSPVYTEWRSEQVNIYKNHPSMRPKMQCLNILESIRLPTEKELDVFIKYHNSK